MVNGLGATKYEELFALYGDIATLLADAGVQIVAPEVGELVTSLDMAGCSLSITWLDAELERYWLAPADTAAFRRGNAAVSTTFTKHREATAEVAVAAVEEASEDSVAAAAIARSAVLAISATVEEHKDYLGQIDAVAGDGDHGIGMSRGARAAAEAAAQTEGGVQTVLGAAGAAFGDKAGGTSGILWGLLLDGVGKSLGNTDAVTDRGGGERRPKLRHRSAGVQQGPARRQDDAGCAVPVRRLPRRRGWQGRAARAGLGDGGAGLCRGGARPRRRSSRRSGGPGPWRSAASAHRTRVRCRWD